MNGLLFRLSGREGIVAWVAARYLDALKIEAPLQLAQD